MPTEAVAATLARLGVEPAQSEMLERYVELVRKWGRAYSLVSKNDLTRLESRHMLDSLGLLPYLAGSRLLDIGSGAGFPGIPLAISRPAMFAMLLDRSEKKARFLRQVVLELDLANVEVVLGDAGRYQPDGLFDTVTARAVTEPRLVWNLARPLLSRDGRVLLQTASRVLQPFEKGVVMLEARGGVGWITAVGLEDAK